jgi:protein SCO1/2
MNETIEDPPGKQLEGRPRVRLRVYVTAGIVLFALLTALIATRYSAYRTVQDKFFGQALVPPKEAFDFHLTDQNGQAFELSQLKGKIALFSFGFTHCPNVCPTTLSELAKIYRQLPEKDRAKVQVLFITIDPERDHVDQMKEYVPYFDGTFIGLTGAPDQIAQAAKAYGVFYEKAPNAGNPADVYFMNHSAYIYLVDPNGKWRILYGFEQLNESDKVADDIKRVLKDTR